MLRACQVLGLFMQFVKISHVAASIVSHSQTHIRPSILPKKAKQMSASALFVGSRHVTPLRGDHV